MRGGCREDRWDPRPLMIVHHGGLQICRFSGMFRRKKPQEEEKKHRRTGLRRVSATPAPHKHTHTQQDHPGGDDGTSSPSKKAHAGRAASSLKLFRDRKPLREIEGKSRQKALPSVTHLCFFSLQTGVCQGSSLSGGCLMSRSDQALFASVLLPPVMSLTFMAGAFFDSPQERL